MFGDTSLALVNLYILDLPQRSEMWSTAFPPGTDLWGHLRLGWCGFWGKFSWIFLLRDSQTSPITEDPSRWLSWWLARRVAVGLRGFSSCSWGLWYTPVMAIGIGDQWSGPPAIWLCDGWSRLESFLSMTSALGTKWAFQLVVLMWKASVPGSLLWRPTVDHRRLKKNWDNQWSHFLHLWDFVICTWIWNAQFSIGLHDTDPHLFNLNFPFEFANLDEFPNILTHCRSRHFHDVPQHVCRLPLTHKSWTRQWWPADDWHIERFLMSRELEHARTMHLYLRCSL